MDTSLPPQTHLNTLSIPPLEMEVFASELLTTAHTQLVQSLLAWIPKLWPIFLQEARQAGILDHLGLDSERLTNGEVAWEVDLHFVENTEMQNLNHQYRAKNEPTDVLSFTLAADAPNKDVWQHLPVIQLGSVFISIPWAEAHHGDQPLERYILERLLHGWLHLFGQNHDTMEEYEKVTAIQNRVLQQICA